MAENVKLELNQEYPLANEAELTAKLVAHLKKVIEKIYLNGLTYRDTHSKGHYVVKGEFTVEPNLPEELRVGLFKEARTYPCWMRFANLSRTPQKDIKGDVRSVSLKLMGVEGQMLWQNDPEAKTLDFIMMGTPKFLAPSLPQFYDMEIALYKGGLSTAWFFLTHPQIFFIIASSFKKCANLLEVPYFSQTAYRFGERAVQYHMTPHQPPTSKVPPNAPNNFLRQRLQEQLATSEAYYDFEVQFQTDPYKMPIEKPSVPWDPKLSPYRKVATIKIPVQGLGTPEQVAFTENISFNPWRTLPEHKPMGAINRVRKEVYPAISQLRRQRNAVPDREPRPEDTF